MLLFRKMHAVSGMQQRYHVRAAIVNMLVAILRQRCAAADSVTHDGYHLVAHLPTSGVPIRLYGRGKRDQGEQETPDRWLQLRILEDALDYNGDASNSERYPVGFAQTPLRRVPRSPAPASIRGNDLPRH